MLVTPLLLASEYRARMNISSGTETNTRLLDSILEESDRLQRFCRRRFDEFIATRAYIAQNVSRRGALQNSHALWLGEYVSQSEAGNHDLRSVSACTNGDGTSIATSALTIDGGLLVVDRDVAFWTAGGNDPRLSANRIQVTGTWGYGGAWVRVGTLDAGLNDSATSLTLAGLEAGMVLKIDSEYLYVESATTGTVERAVNGSTAAAHLSGATVCRWKPMPIVSSLVFRLVSYREAVNKSPMVGQVTLGDALQYTVAVENLPQDVLSTIAEAGLAWRAYVGGV